MRQQTSTVFPFICQSCCCIVFLALPLVLKTKIGRKCGTYIEKAGASGIYVLWPFSFDEERLQIIRKFVAIMNVSGDLSKKMIPKAGRLFSHFSA